MHHVTYLFLIAKLRTYKGEILIVKQQWATSQLIYA